MFPQVSVCHSVQGGPSVTITHDALEPTVHPPPDMEHGDPHPSHGTLGTPPDMGNGDYPPWLVTSDCHHWRPVQTCSLDLTVQAPLPHVTDIWWPLKHVWLVSRRYAFCWNAFLSKKIELISILLLLKNVFNQI